MTARRTTWVFEYFIDTPARVVGEIAAFVYMGTALATAIFVGWLVYQLAHAKIHKWPSVIAGIFFGLWASTIMAQSSHWAAFALLHFGENSD